VRRWSRTSYVLCCVEGST